MKTFEIRVTQNLTGFYEGTIQIEASTPEAALNKLKRKPKKEIDEEVNWSHGDEYDSDYKSIQIHEDSINEI